jgi:LysR family transcriptional regulator, regulator for bpeEF and oprC
VATDRLGSILAFVKVAETGSFAGAGRALGLSASAVSKSVARLEDRLDVRLIQRSTRVLSLTQEGRLLHKRCERILEDLNEAEASVSQHAAVPRGLLRVSLPAALGRIKIVPALGALTTRYPDLRVEASLDDQLSDIIERGFDAVVRIGSPRDSRLMARKVGQVRYIVCGSPDYLRLRGTPEHPDELVQHDCIERLLTDGAGRAPWRFATNGTDAVFEQSVSGSLSLNSNDAIIDAGLSGVGLVQLHTYMAEPHLAAGRLIQVMSAFAADGPPISVLYPSGRHLASKVRVFIDFVSDTLADRSGTGNVSRSAQ